MTCSVARLICTLVLDTRCCGSQISVNLASDENYRPQRFVTKFCGEYAAMTIMCSEPAATDSQPGKCTVLSSLATRLEGIKQQK